MKKHQGGLTSHASPEITGTLEIQRSFFKSKYIYIYINCTQLWIFLLLCEISGGQWPVRFSTAILDFRSLGFVLYNSPRLKPF